MCCNAKFEPKQVAMDQSDCVRPRFTPSPCDAPDLKTIPPLASMFQDEEWLPIVSCPADFPLELVSQWFRHVVIHDHVLALV